MELYRVYVFDSQGMHDGPTDFRCLNACLKATLFAMEHLHAPRVIVTDSGDYTVYESKQGIISWPPNFVEIQRDGNLEKLKYKMRLDSSEHQVN